MILKDRNRLRKRASNLLILVCVLAYIAIFFSGCTQRKPYTAKFGDTKAGKWGIPNDAQPGIKFCWILNLHPRDQIQNVDLYLENINFQKTGLHYNYNPETIGIMRRGQAG